MLFINARARVFASQGAAQVARLAPVDNQNFMNAPGAL
jgi:hypothetical protein